VERADVAGLIGLGAIFFRLRKDYAPWLENLKAIFFDRRWDGWDRNAARRAAASDKESDED
jgi:hypothetical protein